MIRAYVYAKVGLIFFFCDLGDFKVLFFFGNEISRGINILTHCLSRYTHLLGNFSNFGTLFFPKITNFPMKKLQTDTLFRPLTPKGSI